MFGKRKPKQNVCVNTNKQTKTKTRNFFYLYLKHTLAYNKSSNRYGVISSFDLTDLSLN